MRVLRRILLATTMVTALVGQAVPAQAENCKAYEHDAAKRAYCTVVGGCIGSGPVAVDPVICS